MSTYSKISERWFLHMPTSASSRENSWAAINPGMSLRQDDLRHTALYLTSISFPHSLSFSELGISFIHSPWCANWKKNPPFLMVIKRSFSLQLAVLPLLSSRTWQCSARGFYLKLCRGNRNRGIYPSTKPVYTSTLIVTDVLIRCKRLRWIQQND